MSSVPFAKMNGIGNAILVIDVRGTGTAMSGPTARALGTRPGLRFDQLMAVGAPRSAGTDAYVEIFNIDGTRAEACGNGTRCVAWYLLQKSPRTDLTIETSAGLLPCRRLAETAFSVDMGQPQLHWQDIPLRDAVADLGDVPLVSPPAPAMARCAAVGMGNPHAIFFVPNAAAVDLATVGPLIETDAIFPARANVSFAEVVSPAEIKLRVWERGAGATLACGSAACATLVAAVRAGLAEREAQVRLPGGDLTVAWRPSDGHVIMTGPVALEQAGVLSLGAFEAAP